MLKLLFLVMLLTSVKESVSTRKDNSDCQGVSSLQEDLKEFANVIPADDIRNLTKYYYASDTAMRNSYDYLRDEGFRRILNTLESLPFIQKVLAFLNEKGVILKELTPRLGMIVLKKEECAEIEVMMQKDMGGINSFFYESIQLILDELTTLFFVKLENSSEFAKLLENLNANDYETLIDSLKKSQRFQELYFELYSHGIDATDWVKSLRGYLSY